MKERYIIAGLFLTGFLFLSGCGGGAGGAPGSSGSADTGILIEAVSITSENTDIDAHIHLCPPDYTEAEDGLYRENATLSIDAKLVNDSYDPFPGMIEVCTITYKKANEDPAAPTIESFTIYPNCTISDGSSSCAVTLIDIQRKVDYWNDYVGLSDPAEYPTHYVAVYNCTYDNIFREQGSFQVEYDIWLADFDLC